VATNVLETVRLSNTRAEKTNSPFPKLFYRPELDVLRFLAFLMVYVHHATPVPANASHALKAMIYGLQFGVSLFFALSAYLITELLQLEKTRTGTINIKAFYIRRILRIWPLYLSVLTAGFVVSHLHLPHIYLGSTIPTSGFLAYIFLVGNWYTAFSGFLLLGLGHLWSISVEEQFYLLWPSFIRLTTRRSFALVCFLVWIVSQMVLIYICLRHRPSEPTVWVNSFTQAPFFALGAGLSILLHGRSPKLSSSARVLMGIIALALLFAATFAFNTGDPRGTSSIVRTYPGYLIASVAAILLLFSFLGYSRFGELRSLCYLGKISYGLYVYHFPCLMIMSRVVLHFAPRHSLIVIFIGGMLSTVIVASLSYKYFESPLLRFKERFEIVKSRAI
jgi:peptidoglycan/LPS O-acetylase OafA/YrhL